MKKKDTLLINTMCASILLLDNYYELEDTKMYSRELKNYGNLFYKELKRKIEPFETFLMKTGEITQAGEYSDVLESIIGNVSSFDMKDLKMLVSFIDQLKQGNVIDVDADTFEKLKK